MFFTDGLIVTAAGIKWLIASISYLCDAMSHLSHGGGERSSADASGCYDEAVGRKHLSIN